jgi:2-desacetyl-2-hydroxyethyl bacteriochlorophyllide A dehydrogenase
VKRQSLFFDGPGRVALREEPIPEPSEAEVLVRMIVSAISAGSELLVYRDQAPPHMAVDAIIESLTGSFSFPMKYGYACVGEVISLGPGVDPLWQGRKVFSFQPHQSCFITKVNDLFPLPSGMEVLDAVFLPFMETAVTLLLDGQPAVGEQVAVFGQGMVGLLITALLGRIPLSRLLTLDLHFIRRRTSEQLGAHRSVDPNETPIEEIRAFLQGSGDYQGADLSFELSGSPAALDQAIAVTGYSGRVVIGSWYGSKEVIINLGGSFHRSRMKVISSQVSSIDPGLRGRWTKDRIIGLAWRFLEEIKPSHLITHTFPFSDSEKAYHLLDKNPGECLQVVLAY